MNDIVMSDFWKILARFPDIKTLSDLTKLIISMESSHPDIPELFPNAYQFLKGYENTMRSHIYAEWHAQEYLDDSETA
jgi:hypothetical protein